MSPESELPQTPFIDMLLSEFVQPVSWHWGGGWFRRGMLATRVLFVFLFFWIFPKILLVIAAEIGEAIFRCR